MYNFQQEAYCLHLHFLIMTYKGIMKSYFFMHQKYFVCLVLCGTQTSVSWDFVALYNMLDGSLYVEPGVSHTDIKRYLLSLYQLLREVAKRPLLFLSCGVK